MLSQRALEGLRRYVYKPGGYTWLDHAHQPFWNCEFGSKQLIRTNYSIDMDMYDGLKPSDV